jgi:uncharacterized protein (TIGR03067 family)
LDFKFTRAFALSFIVRPRRKSVLEVIILITLGRNIADRARSKGKSGVRAVVLLLVLWFVGEAAGLIAGYLLARLLGGAEWSYPLFCYGLIYCGALIGAIAGARLAFTIVGPSTSSAPPVTGAWRGTASGRRLRLLVILAVLVTVATAVLFIPRSSQPALSADLAALQGEWVLERVEEEGKSRSCTGPRLTITGNEIRGDWAEKAVRFHIDPDKRPPQMDVDGMNSWHLPKSCIYRLQGDQWMLCAQPLAYTRPTNFETRPGSMSALYVYRRVRK